MAEAQSAREAAVEKAYSGNDYQVLVHIIEARELKGRDSSGQSDPVVFVSAFGQKKNTKIMKKTTSCTWDHLMVFQFKTTEQEFLRGAINIEVFDANTFSRNVVIGAHSFDVSRVYNEPSHEFHRRWAALADPSDKFEGVQGYLKLSVVALKPGDVPKVHSASEEDGDEGGSSDSPLQDLVLRPPTIAAEDYELILEVYRAASLPAMDANGRCDPYCEISFAGLSQKSAVKDKTLSPEWNEALCVPVTLPSMSDAVSLRVMDKDQVGSDEAIASLQFSFAEILKAPVEASWVHLYGPAKDRDPTNKDLYDAMARGGKPGSAYRGSLLMSARAVKVAEAKLHKMPVSAPAVPATQPYVLRVDALSACNIPHTSDIWLEVSAGAASSSSKKVDCKNGTATFMQALADVTVQAPSAAGAPDVIIGLYRTHNLRSQRVAFIRIPAAQLKAPRETEAAWLQLSPDLFNVGEDKDAGFVHIRASFSTAAEAAAAPRAAVAAPPSVPHRVRAHLYQARDLPASDANGLSDPFVVVRLANGKAKTHVEKATLFPAWYQTLEFDVGLPADLHMAPNLSCIVKDDDRFGSDVLGKLSVPAIECGNNPGEVKPKWFKIWDPTPEYHCGSLLASFQVFPVSEADKYPVQRIEPATLQCTLEAAIISVDRLQPAMLLPPRAPYVEVTAGSGNSAIMAATHPAKGTQGSSFPVLEVLRLPVTAAADRIFAPPLNITVKDDRPGINPLLGSLSLSLEQFYALQGAAPVKPTAAPVAEVTIDAGEIEAQRESPEALAEKRAKEAASAAAEAKGKEPAAAAAPAGSVVVDMEAASAGAATERAVLIEKKVDAGPSDAELRNIQEGRTLPPVAESSLEGVGEVPAEQPDEEHKRKHVERELEHEFQPPYHTYSMTRGKLRKGSKARPSEEAGLISAEFRLVEKGANLPPLVDVEALRKERRVVVRLYILRGRVVPMDTNGLCDPYLVVTNGPKTTFKRRDDDKHKEKTLEPEFYQVYEVPCTLPLQNEVTVAVWDWDRAGGDDFVGLTRIDVMRRINSPAWHALGKDKPVENRTLWNPSSSAPQGHLEMWIDVLPEEEAARVPAIYIGPPPTLNFELRVVIWNTEDVKFRDKSMSDIFLVGYTHHSNPQRTDVHWRSTDGKGMFNWRYVLPLSLPAKTGPHLTVQVWDKDVLNPNDVIAEAKISLRALCKRAYATQKSVSLPRQWIEMSHPNYSGPQGRVEVTLELLTQEEALRNPVGKGRDPPNALPEPNRPKTSFAFWRLDKYITVLFWGKYKWWIIGAAVLALAILILIVIVALKV